MKYYEVNFTITAPESIRQDVADVLMALVADAGFETFQSTDDGFTGYVQQSQLQQPVLDALVAQLPFDGVAVNYEVVEADHRDWNEQWEQEGFAPVTVGRDCVVHDGRHINGVCLEEFRCAVEIDAHLAFGTGNHETTRLMIASLTKLSLNGTRVLDCGCGTGILGIVALKLGAQQAVGYDIDEWSADNARHNAVINGVEHAYVPLLGDASVLDSVAGLFDVVVANINRNILLADMPTLRSRMKTGGHLLISGFYSADRDTLVKRATDLGLQLYGERTDGDWMCLAFTLSS